jgi:hypothetical protein
MQIEHEWLATSTADPSTLTALLVMAQRWIELAESGAHRSDSLRSGALLRDLNEQQMDKPAPHRLAV